MPDETNLAGEALVFRRDGDKLYLTNAAWPQVALRIAEAEVTAAGAVELLRDEANGGQLVNIVVANGFALYAVQPDGSAKYVEGELSPAPAAPDAAPVAGLDVPPTPEAPLPPVIDQTPAPEVAAVAPAAAPEAETAPRAVPLAGTGAPNAPEAPLADVAKPADPMPPIEEDPRRAELRAALQAQSYRVGAEIKYDVSPLGVGLFPCGVDERGRVWKVDEENGRLILAGTLLT